MVTMEKKEDKAEEQSKCKTPRRTILMTRPPLPLRRQTESD